MIRYLPQRFDGVTFAFTFGIGIFAFSALSADDDPFGGGRRAVAVAPGEQPPGHPPPEGQPSTSESSGEDSKDESTKNGDAKEESAAPKIIRRDGLEMPSGDPSELKATIGDDGKVGFRFRNQGWVDLIGWLSDISAQPIDWQELPGDAVNLVSPDRLTVAETADLINRHLLARGYTMLKLEGGITIVKTAAINSGMVHRVDIAELEKLPDHTFVRTTLDAGWLSAESLAKELAPMLSGAGKLTALITTNRIEAMDAAVNLRQIAHLLSEERDAASRDALAPEFKLQHIPAEEAKKLLEQFLGVEEKENTPMTRDQMRMMQQMQQQNGGQPPPPKEKIEISIVANVRQNSVLVRAPIDRVAIAAEFIKRIDVPGGSLRSLADASSRVEVFRLVSLDPEKLIEIAQEMNVLEPTTRIRVDKENKAVIVSGAAADRFIVQSLIERLDGGKRRLEVLQLRRLEAGEVAESISFLMGQEQEKESNNSRRYSYYGWGGDEQEEKEEDEFRVAANARYRQVLLWANENEMEEVRSLLIKLGELPPPGGSGRTVRMIEASATPETLEYLQKLKAQWQAMSPNQLILPSAEAFEEAEKTESTNEASENEEVKSEKLEEPIAAQERAIERAEDYLLTSDQNGEMSDDEGYAEDSPAETADPAPGQAPPVEIRLDENGNLILSSRDTKALDALENLMLDLKPPTRGYHVFRIKNASVTLLALDLEDYFKEEDEKKEDNSDRFYRWYFDDEDDSTETGPTGLARGNKLRFLPNSDTGTIVVTGASSGQLQTIRELIELWDVAEPVNARRSRFTKLVTIRYGRSEKIADTVKEAYRDLLSSNDKTFATGGGERNGKPASNRNEGSGLEDSESGKDGGSSDFSFNGKLSLGVDEIGNTLLVSAEGEALLDLIVSMIEKLDEAAQPGGEIEIVRFSGDLSAEALRDAMSVLGVKAGDSNSSSRNRDSDNNNSRRSDSRRNDSRSNDRNR